MIRIEGFGAERSYNRVLRPVGIRGGFGNFEWTTDFLLPAHSSPLAVDLMRIGRAVHLADRLVRRGVSIRRQLRRIKVEVVVARRDHWENVRELLEELLEAATGGDSWTLCFKDGARDEVATSDTSSHSNRDENVVALFSGGLDSLCGAAHLAADSGARPIFVTHSPPGKAAVTELVRMVFRAFDRDLPTNNCVSFRLEPRESNRAGRRALFQEPSRRTRPFYFLSLAAAVALAREIAHIQMAENGALALSLPHRADAHGPSMARQAHTFLLHGFERLLRELVPHVPWVVQNPFVNQTKGEACLELGPAKALAASSTSCEYLGRQRAVMIHWIKAHPRAARVLGEGPHCGLCIPCLVRRAALHCAAIADPDRGYFAAAPQILQAVHEKETAIEFYEQKHSPPLMNMLVPNVLYLENHCKRLLNLSPAEFAIQYLPELRANRPLQGAVDAELEAFHRLTKRYAHEILSFLNG